MTFGKIQPIDELLSSINVSQFTEDWNSGMALVDLAKKYNLAYPEKAKRLGKALGLKMREIAPLGPSTDELLSSINVSSFIEDWNSGMTLVDLANKYNFAYPDKAKRLAKTLGLVAGTRTSRIDESVDKDKFIELYYDEKKFYK